MARADACLYALLAMMLACTGVGAGDELGEGTSESGTSESGTSESGTSESGTSESGTSESGTSESGTSESGTSESGTSESGTSESGGDVGPRVLFVGNSYTASNDLPGMFAAASLSAGVGYEAEMHAIGGATVADHVANPMLATTLAAGWDAVVIQAQSYEAIIDYPGYAQAMHDFDALVDVQSPGARLIVFETWARAPGHPLLADLNMTSMQMQAALSTAYAEAAAAVGAELAPVGQAWTQAGVEAPQLELHSGDGSHPSLAGSFLACAVFVGVITEVGASTSEYTPPGMADVDADQLEAIADAITLP